MAIRIRSCIERLLFHSCSKSCVIILLSFPFHVLFDKELFAVYTATSWRIHSQVRPSGTDRKETVGDEGVVQCNEVLFRPDAKSVYVHTFGCSHNMSDGETMKGLLAAGGYNVTTNKKDADVWYA